MSKPTRTRLPLGHMSTQFLLLIQRALATRGLDSTELFERYGIGAEALLTPENRISIPKFMRIGHDAIRLSGQATLGLIMGQQARVTDFGVSGFLAMAAQDLGLALNQLAQFETLNSQNSRGHSRFYYQDTSGHEVVRTENGQTRAVFNFYSISPYNQYNFFVVDFMLSSIFELCQWLTGQTSLLKQVEIEYAAPANPTPFEQRFGCPVYFGATRNALVFRSGLHGMPIRFANTAVFHEMRELCQRKLALQASGKSTRQRVIDLIGPELCTQSVSLEQIAARMGMASWSLRRRLQLEGYQFQTLLDETRCEMAKSYVRDTHHNFTEIAYLLGFANPPGFQRAFRRWTGMSPGEFRAHNNPS